MRRGLTLIEVLIGMVLALALLGMLVGFLVPTLQFSARGHVRMDVQNDGFRGMTRLIRDLQASAPETITITPQAIGMFRLSTVLDDGAQVWDTQLIVYALDNKSLVRRNIDPAGFGVQTDSRRPRSAPPNLLTESAPATILARDVSDFRISHAGTDKVVAPITLFIALERNGQRFQYSRSITPVNRVDEP